MAERDSGPARLAPSRSERTTRITSYNVCYTKLLRIPGRLLYDEGDALMFRTTEFGDEKDRAVRRSTGVPTYFGGDIAHYHETAARRFDQLVNVLRNNFV